MSALVDTHIALWTLADSPKLSRRMRTLLEDPSEAWYVSAVSIWEVMLKHQAHPDKMIIDAPTFTRDCEAAGFRVLNIQPEHMFEAAELPIIPTHKDPFDRMLLAQARRENFVLVTHDSAFAAYNDTHVVLV